MSVCVSTRRLFLPKAYHNTLTWIYCEVLKNSWTVPLNTRIKLFIFFFRKHTDGQNTSTVCYECRYSRKDVINNTIICAIFDAKMCNVGNCTNKTREWSYLSNHICNCEVQICAKIANKQRKSLTFKILLIILLHTVYQLWDWTLGCTID